MPEEKPTSQRPVILVIEPDPMLRRGLAVAIEACGYAPVTAADAHDAITCMSASVRPVAVILALLAPELDVVNPAMDGRRFGAWLQTNLPGTPVVVLASGGNTAAASRSLNAQDYLEKPVTPEVVAEVVDRVVRVARTRGPGGSRAVAGNAPP